MRDSAPAAGGTVRAAGGVVVRGGDGEVELVVVHRPNRSDWTLPKGKLEPGETELECALREVEEESGLRCRPLRDCGATEYVDDRGRPKHVAWWLMEPTGGELRAATEADDARWVTVSEALELLSYESDRELLLRLRDLKAV
jgi:8-oxo-dGTP diphosphatase